MKFCLVAFSLLASAPSLATAFSVVPSPRSMKTLRRPTGALAMVTGEDDSKATSIMSPKASPAIAKRSDLDKGPAKKMDQAIFTFNKFLIDTVYDIICLIYPVRGTERDFARFFVLETVARVPYFAYLSVLHLRETFGERHSGDKMRTHYAEADNELHHLLIMEALGGNKNILDRTLAQTMAFFYYWYVVIVYVISEEAAYHLSELIEDHAYDTYDNFLKNYEDRLKQMPVPDIAYKYYVEENPFLFDLFCTVKEEDGSRNFSQSRPTLNSLYDVFVNIRDDEKEHWKTLCNLVQYGDMQGVSNKLVRSTEPLATVE